jgi:hypothetical protein
MKTSITASVRFSIEMTGYWSVAKQPASARPSSNITSVVKLSRIAEAS